jgi:putative NIF3 family GTP cyclohydrolase 1 type 2
MFNQAISGKQEGRAYFHDSARLRLNGGSSCRLTYHIRGTGTREAIRSLGWCTGAAQSYLEAAAGRGLDAFISGEISEQTVHIARECGIHYFAAGHRATERFGVQVLGNHLTERFGLRHRYIDIENPV